MTSPTDLRSSGLAPVTDWRALRELSDASGGISLDEADPLSSVFAVQPAVWADRDYDAVEQRFTWILKDERQTALRLELAFDTFTARAIEFFEHVTTDVVNGSFLVGRVQRTVRGLTLHPFALHQANGEVVQLHLDGGATVAESTTSEAVADSQPDTTADDDQGFDVEEEVDEERPIDRLVGRLLDEVDDVLLSLSESGSATVKAPVVERLVQLSSEAERVGLSALARVLGASVARPDARATLRCLYVSRLHRRAATRVTMWT